MAAKMCDKWTRLTSDTTAATDSVPSTVRAFMAKSVQSQGYHGRLARPNEETQLGSTGMLSVSAESSTRLVSFSRISRIRRD